MTDSISQDTFDHLVGLAALELAADQAAYLLHELNNQLKAIHELAAIPLEESTHITSHGVPYSIATSPLPREDDWRPHPNPAEILAQAPETDGGYIVVPDIPHTTLE